MMNQTQRQTRVVSRGVTAKKSLDDIFGSMDGEEFKDFMSSFREFVDPKDLEDEEVGDFFYKMQDSFLDTTPDFDFGASVGNLFDQQDDDEEEENPQDDGFHLAAEKKPKKSKKKFLMKVLQNALQQWEEAEEEDEDSESEEADIEEQIIQKVLENAGTKAGKVVGVRRRGDPSSASNGTEMRRSRSKSGSRRTPRGKKSDAEKERLRSSRGRPRQRDGQQSEKPRVKSTGRATQKPQGEVSSPATPVIKKLVRKDPITPTPSSPTKSPTKLKGSPSSPTKLKGFLSPGKRDRKIGGQDSSSTADLMDKLNSSGHTSATSKSTKSRTSRVALRKSRARSVGKTPTSQKGRVEAPISSSHRVKKHPMQIQNLDDESSDEEFSETEEFA